jgi:hypothetical protein
LTPVEIRTWLDLYCCHAIFSSKPSAFCSNMYVHDSQVHRVLDAPVDLQWERGARVLPVMSASWPIDVSLSIVLRPCPWILIASGKRRPFAMRLSAVRSGPVPDIAANPESAEPDMRLCPIAATLEIQAVDLAGKMCPEAATRGQLSTKFPLDRFQQLSKYYHTYILNASLP